MAYSARVLLDSISPAGVRFTTLEVTFPRFVLSEFNTHRNFCLDGETLLYFDLPKKSRGSLTRRFTVTLRELYEKWHYGAAARANHPRIKKAQNIDPAKEYTAEELAAAAGYSHYTGIDLLSRRVGIRRIVTPGQRYRILGADFLAWQRSVATNRQPIKWRLREMQLRSCNEDTGEIYHTRVRDVTYSGKKPVFRVRLKTGREIICSKDHRFLTRNGWESLEEAVGLVLSPGGVAAWKQTAELAVNGTPAYSDPDWLRAQRDAGLSARAIAQRAGVTLDRIKYQFRKHRIFESNPEAVWRNSHIQEPWNKGLNYCNIKTRGQKSKARVRRGPDSHLWRGGTTPERKMIGAWTQHEAFRTHRKNGFKCVLCGSDERLHAHHVDPVANNPMRAYDPTNLTSLCGHCHGELHQRNLDLLLLDYTELGRPFADFWNLVGSRKLQRPLIRKKKRAMVRHFVPVQDIEFVGVRDTYDIEVQGPYNNFVAEGFIVHNSRNSASSRAVPTSKLLEKVANEPVLPLEWGRNKAGMSAEDVLTPEEEERAKAIWLSARDAALKHARDLLDLKVHKQELNRILEPFLWHTVIVTSTEWDNFFTLRCAPTAQPEIREAAMRMRAAMEESTPQPVGYGQWHLPLVQDDERTLDIETQKKISAARCARVSYLTHGGTREIEKDIELHDRLKRERHLSPFEHVATPEHDARFYANVRGWRQMRGEIETALTRPATD